MKKEEAIKQLREVQEFAKEVAGKSSGQTYTTYSQIAQKAKELIVLLEGI